MCGFFNYLNNKSIDKELNQKCIDSLKLLNHRGPDDTEYINYKNNFLGFSRLSIIDRDNGKQPMFNHDKVWQ